MQEKILHFGSLFCVSTPQKTTLPEVCSPVEAGEVARVAWRRGGDLPRGLHYVQDDNISYRHCVY